MPKQQQSLERQAAEERLAMERAIRERRVAIYTEQVEQNRRKRWGRKITYTNIM